MKRSTHTQDADHDPLTRDVSQADLSKYPDHELDGRLVYYEREHLFERDARLRAAFRKEIDRTRIEINRRKMYAREEAERVFKL
jgi:hypothetical protein